MSRMKHNYRILPSGKFDCGEVIWLMRCGRCGAYEPPCRVHTPLGMSELEVYQDTCQHWWVIESPHGSMSKGVCKKCGEVREFLNSFPERTWAKTEK